MVEVLKKIWFNKIVIVIVIVQILFTLIFGKPFFNISLKYFIFTSIMATIFINLNLYWLFKKGKADEYKRYLKDAPCTMQAIKFTLGMLVSVAIVLYNEIHPINGIENHIGRIFISWYLVPLIMVFFSADIIELGINDKISFRGKIRKVPSLLKKFLFTFFDYNEHGKLNINFKSVVNTLAFLIMIVLIIIYYLSYVLS